MAQLFGASIVIPTYNRTEHIEICLDHVLRQSVSPVEIVVVDASPGHETEQILERYPDVTYVRSRHGRGTTATSRAIGVAHSTGDVVVFLDDDAYPAATWLEELLKRYDAPDVAGVGGRTDNGRPEEEGEGLDLVGRLLPDGRLTGYFAAVTPGDVDVDHLLGANMSIRRDVIDQLGGIRDFYPGTCLREESDIALRARQAGYRLVYTPDALVRHMGGSYAKGRRFDLRYEYYGARNHVVLLKTALGWDDPRARAHLKVVARNCGGHLRYAGRSAIGRPGGSASRLRGTANGLLRAGVQVAGTGAGYLAAARHQAAIRHPSTDGEPDIGAASSTEGAR